MNIREAAIHCECRKIAYRQSKDGIVLSLLLHPQEVPDALATAALGARYMVAFVELGDDEQPIKPDTGRRETALPEREGESDKVAGSPSRTRRTWGELSPAQQAGLLCGDPMFQQFLYERGETTTPDKDEAAEAVRVICSVMSRKEITPQNSWWRDLVADYRNWQRGAA